MSPSLYFKYLELNGGVSGYRHNKSSRQSLLVFSKSFTSLCHKMALLETNLDRTFSLKTV